METYDFSGWATRANVKCSDGRTIMKDAFKHNDGKKVPLVWGHQHEDISAVLGHALLRSKEEGIYAYCKLNDTESGQIAREIIKHGDVEALSIFANQLKEENRNVVHGNIRELSLVLAGANIGAFIDNIIMHGEDSTEEAVIYHGLNGMLVIESDEELADTEDSDNSEDLDENQESTNDTGDDTSDIDLTHADGAVKDDEKKDDTTSKKEKEDAPIKVKDVLATFNDEQQTVVEWLVGEALQNKDTTEDDESKGGNDDMKHNVFDNAEKKTEGYISHSDQTAILNMAKSSQVGTFQGALEIYADENELQHDALASGFTQGTTEGTIYSLFDEYHDVKPGAPELVTNDQGWISTVMAKVHKSPFSRIRTSHVDIRNIDTLRAKGYTKGKKKGIVGNYNLVRRTTDPQTVFIKNALHKDDINDINTFDIVKYQYDIDRMMLNEELATAFLFGDNREVGAEGKIEEDKIRPIWKDDELYTRHYDLDIAKAKSELQGTGTGVSFGENYIIAEAMINTVLYAREKFRGTGTPDMFIEPHMLNVMLLARDMNGRRIYSSRAELETALNVGKIYTVEQIAGKTRTTSDTSPKTKKLIALIVNLADYSVGATKGGQVTHFSQFDIDFNQQKSLLETRCCSALTKIYSAIAIEEDVTNSSGAEDEAGV